MEGPVSRDLVVRVVILREHSECTPGVSRHPGVHDVGIQSAYRPSGNDDESLIFAGWVPAIARGGATSVQDRRSACRRRSSSRFRHA